MILTQEQIKKTVQAYFRDKPVKKAYLFGSYARGKATDKSDVDLIVELDYSMKIGLDFIRWMYDLEKDFGKKTDLVPHDSMYSEIQEDADKYKIPLFVNYHD